mgnify:CR=1 FL=1
MKFTCEKNALVSAISVASRTVAQKSTIPALEGIYIRAGVKLTLSGYNLETGITISVDADIQETGACIMPSRLFFDIIRKLPDDTVSISVDENFKVSIRGGISSFSITAMSSEDYPELPDVGDGREIYIPQNKLKELISGTIFAVSENQGRPIHTGVKFEVTNDAITAVAVDGFRLARRTFHPEEGTGRELNFVVPAAGLKEVEKILTDVEDNAAFTLGTKHILFQVGNATLVCRLLEGEFIRYRQILPEEWQTRVTVDRAELGSAIDRASLIAREGKSNLVCFKLDGETLEVSSNSETGDMEEKMQVITEGKDLTIAFNVRYITDVLKALSDDQIVMRFNSNVSPCVVCPVEGDSYLYLVLPVRVFNA